MSNTTWVGLPESPVKAAPAEKKYTVRLSREVTEYLEVPVSATSTAHACQLAQTLAHVDANWKPDADDAYGGSYPVAIAMVMDAEGYQLDEFGDRVEGTDTEDAASDDDDDEPEDDA